MQWVTSYFGNRILRHVRRDMAQLAAAGFTEIVHTFSENDLFYSPGTLRDIVRATRDEGLAVQIDPWGVAGIFGGEAFSRWIVEDADLQQRAASGRLLGGACLNHPRLRDRLTEWLDAAARTGAERVFWDEPHWVPAGPRNPGGEVCVCEHCLAAWGRWHDARREPPDAAAHSDDAQVPGLDAVPRAQYERFRADSVARLLAELCERASERHLGSSICVLPQGTLGQPPLAWAELARLSGVEIFGTDPYWHAFGVTEAGARDRFIDLNAKAARDAARPAGADTMLWIQAFRIPAGAQDAVIEGTRRLLAHQPDRTAIWGFEACAHMSELACGNAPALWQRFLELIAETRAGHAGPRE